jgi:hypothetical protein
MSKISGIISADMMESQAMHGLNCDRVTIISSIYATVTLQKIRNLSFRVIPCSVDVDHDRGSVENRPNRIAHYYT